MEEQLTCEICQSIFFDPVKLLDCHHIYCGSCIKQWLKIPQRACPHCRLVPRAATSDRFINNCVEGYLTDHPQRAPSDTEKAEKRRNYQPGTNISPSVPFISPVAAGDPPQGLAHNRPSARPPRVVTPVMDEAIQEISRPPPRVENATPPIRRFFRPNLGQEIAAARPEPRVASPSLEQLLFGQPAARAPVSTPENRGSGGGQYANTINNYSYYGYRNSPAPNPTPVPQQRARPTPAYSPYGVVINGVPLDNAKYLVLMSTGVTPQPGNYWYDDRSGLYGFHGGPCLGQILPRMDLGGPLASNASGYWNTCIYINGREIHVQDLLTLHKWGLFPAPGTRYWLEANGTYGREGIPFPPEGNLSMNAAAIMSSYMISRAMTPSCVIL